MRRLSVVLVVLSLIVTSLVFMPVRVSAEDTPQFVVQKWADVPEGAFLLRFEKDYTGIASSSAPLYVATKQGDNTVIYKIASQNADAMKVLSIEGNYKYFDFDPAYKGYMFVLTGGLSNVYGDTITIYQNGRKINSYQDKRMFGLSHWKNYIVFANTLGVNTIYWSNNAWKKNTVAEYGSLTKSVWSDVGEYYHGFGQIAWYEKGEAGGYESLGENNVEAMFKDEDLIHMVLTNIDSGKRSLYQLIRGDLKKLFDLDDQFINALFTIDDTYIIYANGALYNIISDGTMNKVVDYALAPVFHDGKIWFIGKDGIYTLAVKPYIPSVKAIFDVGSGEVEYKDFANWKGVLAIENSDTTTVSVSCSPNVDWLLPDAWSVTVGPGKTSKASVMPKPSAIEAHWPTAPSIYGSYTCNIKWSSGNMVQHTSTLRVKLPQLAFKSLVYDINVSQTTTDVEVVRIENGGDGLGEVTCEANQPWAHIKMAVDGGTLHDTALAVIRKMGIVALNFDYGSMPTNGLVDVTCRWAGGSYQASFNVIKQAETKYSLNIITTKIPLADVIDDFATIANVSVSGGSIPLSVSADKSFIIVKADSEISNGSADISISIDRKKITFADMTLPYIKVNLTIQYGDRKEVIPVKIEIKRALKLFVPKNKLEQSYELWTPEEEWQKLVSPDSAPFINPLYNRTYVPLRLVSDGLGLKVGWDDKNRLITIESDKFKIVLDVKKVVKKKVKIAGRYEYIYESTNRYAKVYDKMAGATSYGRSVYVYPTAIRRNRSYVPIRFIAEQVKSLVFWDGKTRTVYIYR